MINLTEEDKEIIRRLGYPKIVDLSVGSFLVKEDYEETGINELISKKIADILNIKCPKYFLAEVDNKRYVLSEDLNKKGKFKSAYEHVPSLESDYERYPLRELYQDDNWYDEEAKNMLHGNSLYDIWTFLERNYDATTTKRLMQDIVKIYTFDVLFLNYDRSTSNWGILTSPSDQVDVVMFDNELIFHQTIIFSGTVSMNVDFLKDASNVYDDFRRFLKESSKEFIDLFKYYFDLITEEFLKILIETIEKENNLPMSNKEEFLNIYHNHRETLMKIYNEEMNRGEAHGR